mmetsp:Transcript_10772/g.18897  ORF Transcript_10772/g.18897 Transcript_10772/m.18897 type:complete len:110 (-) Transcript_10772:107-436(-)
MYAAYPTGAYPASPMGTYQYQAGAPVMYDTANMPTVGTMTSIPTAPQMQAYPVAYTGYPGAPAMMPPAPSAFMPGTQPMTNPQLGTGDRGVADAAAPKTKKKKSACPCC